jgi:hypothetical protein
MNISKFPDFVNIFELSEDSFKPYSDEFLDYSDINFTNVWSWNIDSSFKASVLNENLILLCRDIISKEFFLSIYGTNLINESLFELFEYANNNSISCSLLLIPEKTARCVDLETFTVSEDRNSFDYIFETKLLTELHGKEYKSKRHSVNQFINKYPSYSVHQKHLIPSVKLEILKFMSTENRKRSALGHTLFSEYEMAALEHFFLLPNKKSIVASMLYIDHNLVGFSVDEIISKTHALSHFVKVDINFRGSYDTLNFETAKFLHESNIQYWNWVEDMGLPGLRQAKLAYRPSHFLKKYIISL